jgi:hypothetical protein
VCLILIRPGFLALGDAIFLIRPGLLVVGDVILNYSAVKKYLVVSTVNFAGFL